MALPFRQTPAISIDAPERRRLPILLRHAWYGLNQAFRRRIAHTGVTPDQFTALRTILEGDRKGMLQSEMTRLMASDPNTVGSLIDRMEKAGLIERRPHETDRRAYRIRLKPAGQKKYEEVRAMALDLPRDILRALPEKRREAFLTELALVADTCRAAAEKSPKRKGVKTERGPKL